MSITSERQRRLDPVNGGFVYYTLFHTDKGERPDYAEVGDIIEEFGQGGKVFKLGLDAKGRKVWSEDATWDRQTGGSGGGSYTLPTASASTKGGVKIGSGLSMDGEVLSATGGAEKFIVTLTHESDTWTADKTIAEIVAADAAGKEISGIIEAGFAPQNMFCLFVLSVEGESVVSFSPLVSAESGTITTTSVFGLNDGESDVWQVNEQEGALVPSHSSSNNGQVLGVSSGSLAWVDSNAPLIVTLTADQSTGNLVGDKTNEEVYSAFTAGKAVIMSANVGSATFKLAVQYATFDGTDYEFSFIDSSSVKNTVAGGANDYVTASFA